MQDWVNRERMQGAPLGDVKAMKAYYMNHIQEQDEKLKRLKAELNDINRSGRAWENTTRRIIKELGVDKDLVRTILHEEQAKLK